MSVLTIAITQVQDLNGFVNAANEYGNDRVLEMGCKHTQVAKIIMGGEAAGLVGVSFEWDFQQIFKVKFRQGNKKRLC